MPLGDREVATSLRIVAWDGRRNGRIIMERLGLVVGMVDGLRFTVILLGRLLRRRSMLDRLLTSNPSEPGLELSWRILSGCSALADQSVKATISLEKGLMQRMDFLLELPIMVGLLMASPSGNGI